MKCANVVLSNELTKVELSPSKIWKADVLSISPLSEQRVNNLNT